MAITVQQFDLIAAYAGIGAALNAAQQAGGVTGSRTGPTNVGTNTYGGMSLTPGSTPGTTATPGSQVLPSDPSRAAQTAYQAGTIQGSPTGLIQPTTATSGLPKVQGSPLPSGEEAAAAKIQTILQQYLNGEFSSFDAAKTIAMRAAGDQWEMLVNRLMNVVTEEQKAQATRLYAESHPLPATRAAGGGTTGGGTEQPIPLEEIQRDFLKPGSGLTSQDLIEILSQPAYAGMLLNPAEIALAWSSMRDAQRGSEAGVPPPANAVPVPEVARQGALGPEEARQAQSLPEFMRRVGLDRYGSDLNTNIGRRAFNIGVDPFARTYPIQNYFSTATDPAAMEAERLGSFQSYLGGQRPTTESLQNTLAQIFSSAGTDPERFQGVFSNPGADTTFGEVRPAFEAATAPKVLGVNPYFRGGYLNALEQSFQDLISKFPEQYNTPEEVFQYYQGRNFFPTQAPSG